MSKSLQDQLLELGLATSAPGRKQGRSGKKQPRGQARREKTAASEGRRAKAPEALSQASGQNGTEISLAAAYLQREKEETRAREAARRQKIEQDRLRAAVNRKIRALVDAHRLNQADAEESRYFMYKGRIRKVFVTAEQLQALNSQELGLVYLAGSYHLMAPEHCRQVASISAEHVVDLGTDESGVDD